MIIGVTGYTGSGKSYTAKCIKEACSGMKIFDADRVCHSLYKNQKVLSKLEKAFGKKIFITTYNDKYKSLVVEFSRELLAKKVGYDSMNMKILEDILYPHLMEALEVFKEKNENIIIDAVKLFGSGIYRFCDTIVLVEAPTLISLDRLSKREPHTGRLHLMKRIRYQKSFINYKMWENKITMKINYPNSWVK